MAKDLISIRLPISLVDKLKAFARLHDMPYQTLINKVLAMECEEMKKQYLACSSLSQPDTREG